MCQTPQFLQTLVTQVQLIRRCLMVSLACLDKVKFIKSMGYCFTAYLTHLVYGDMFSHKQIPLQVQELYSILTLLPFLYNHTLIYLDLVLNPFNSTFYLSLSRTYFLLNQIYFSQTIHCKFPPKPTSSTFITMGFGNPFFLLHNLVKVNYNDLPFEGITLFRGYIKYFQPILTPV